MEKSIMVKVIVRNARFDKQTGTLSTKQSIGDSLGVLKLFSIWLSERTRDTLLLVSVFVYLFVFHTKRVLFSDSYELLQVCNMQYFTVKVFLLKVPVIWGSSSNEAHSSKAINVWMAHIFTDLNYINLFYVKPTLKTTN